VRFYSLGESTVEDFLLQVIDRKSTSFHLRQYISQIGRAFVQCFSSLKLITSLGRATKISVPTEVDQLQYYGCLE
jgi:hypothetical protein